MSPGTFKLTIHMVSSLDGFVAKKNNSVSWFDTSHDYDKGVTVQNPEAFLKTIDCYIMGSHTYELALELSASYGWAYGDTPVIVLTSRPLPVTRENIELYSGSPDKLITEKLKPGFKNVWLVGGPATIRDFIRLNLADEIRVSVLPIILGDGIPFFDHIGRELPLRLKDTVAYKTGMVELVYEINKA